LDGSPPSVSASQLTPATQLDLFGAAHGAVDDTVDAVRERFGKLALRRADSLE